MAGVNDIRKANARLLIDQRFAGVDARLAGAIGRSPSQVHRWFMDGRHQRLMGERLARDVEARLGLSAGWLDVAQADAPEIRDGAEFAAIVALIEHLTLAEKIDLMGVLAQSAKGA